jgi:hypothetical protein
MVVSGRSRGRGRTQHIASQPAENTATSCVAGPQRAGGRKADPGLPVFGSSVKKKDDGIWLAYPYAGHLHMLHLYIC